MGFFLEDGYISLNKKGEELCGDKVEILREPHRTTLVLSDGLGSGVKANILATLTSKILCAMASNNLPIEECVKTLADSLPVCKVRNVAYSTFSLISVDEFGKGYIVEYDNPQAIILRDGKYIEFERKLLDINDKKIYLTDLQLEEGDLVFFLSDGAPHAGIGKSLNFGWKRENIIDFLMRNYHPDYTASAMAALLGDICNYLYLYEPGDDTTVSCVRVRTHSIYNVMIGPPNNPKDDEKVLSHFFSLEGKKIICGGTTSQMVSRFLNQPCDIILSTMTKDIPPIGYIPGVELTTEGVITLRKLLTITQQYLDIHDCTKKHYDQDDGASKLAHELIENATEINLFVGTSINDAHKDLPIDSTMKMKIVEKLKVNFERIGKNVTITYY